MEGDAIAVVQSVLSGIALAIGSIFAVIGAIGILRLPDFYSRMHGAGITDTMGAGMILLGLMLQAGLSLVMVKLLLILVFIFFTSPTATHAVAKAALGSGLEPKLGGKEEGPSKT